MKKVPFFLIIFFLVAGLNFVASSQVLEGPPRDGVYDRSAITQVQPIPYPYLREADVTWTKRIWRVIDLREKMNQPFYFPEKAQNNWKSFMAIVMDGLKEGTISAYSDMNDQFTMPITYKELEDRLQTSSKQTLSRADNPDEKFDTTIVRDFDATDVKTLRIKEDYYFDRQRSVMEVRILGICPVGDSYDAEGNYRGTKPLFWIYFPECRNLFAKNEMFNLKNGAAGRLTYDDVFMKRMFSSYIMKEENVYDRYIQDYAVGTDALLEAERAKNTIFEFESNLWEY